MTNNQQAFNSVYLDFINFENAEKHYRGAYGFILFEWFDLVDVFWAFATDLVLTWFHSSVILYLDRHQKVETKYNMIIMIEVQQSQTVGPWSAALNHHLFSYSFHKILLTI